MTHTTSTRAAWRQPVVLWVAALCAPGLAMWVAVAINLVCFIVGADKVRGGNAMGVVGMLFIVGIALGPLLTAVAVFVAFTAYSKDWTDAAGVSVMKKLVFAAGASVFLAWVTMS